jgi:hypothetical protein
MKREIFDGIMQRTKAGPLGVTKPDTSDSLTVPKWPGTADFAARIGKSLRIYASIVTPTRPTRISTAGAISGPTLFACRK